MSTISNPRFARLENPPIDATQSPLDRIDAQFRARHDATSRCATRSPSTVWDYRKTLIQLFSQVGLPGDVDARDRLCCAVTWFSEQAGRWKKSVIRHHRASLLWGVEHLACAGEIDLDDVQLLIAALDRPLESRTGTGQHRTSADKRKGVSSDEHLALLKHFTSGKTKTSRLLAGLLGWGVCIALRPCEYREARICGSHLVVKGAKTTNGRGLGERTIDLAELGTTLLDALHGFIDNFRAAGDASASWETFQQRLAKALSRACRKLQIPQICLYTLRHQALSNGKVWLTSPEIAAFAGHVSPTTASRNYAGRRGGWGRPILCRPAAETVARVSAAPVRRSKVPSLASLT